MTTERMRFSHVPIHVHDLERMIEFYTDILGLQLVEIEPGVERMKGSSVTPFRGELTYVLLSCKGKEYNPDKSTYVCLIEDHDRDKDDEYEVGRNMKVPHLTFVVDNLDKKAEKLKKRRVEFLVENAKPSHTDHILREDFIKDPEGFIICLEELQD